MVGVAVNVTFVPAQMVVEGLAAIETLTGKFGFTVIATVFDVAGLPVAQGVALDVKTQVTTSPLINPAFVYAGEFIPTFEPFSFH